MSRPELWWLFCLGACADGERTPVDSSSPTEPSTTTTEVPPSTPDGGLVVGPEGGELVFLDGEVVLSVPAGAVDEEVVITAVPSGADPVLDPAPLDGAHYEFGPDGAQFAVPVRLSVRYDASAIEPDVVIDTMTLGKSTPEGWISLPSEVDTDAQTVHAEISSFSAYGVVPGLQQMGAGSVAGMGMRPFDWGGLGQSSIAADTAGSVFVAGIIDDESGSLPLGPFLAKLNFDLSTQWIRSLPPAAPYQTLLVRCDQQGNAYVAYSVPGAATPEDYTLTSYDPSGSVRAGFPVTWSAANYDRIVGAAIDGVANVHVLGQTDLLGQNVYTVIRSDGSFATEPVNLPLPIGPNAFETGGWDLGLDSQGNLYITSFWSSPTDLQSDISSFDPTLSLRPGFPQTFPSAFGIGRAVNSLTGAAIDLVPVGSYDRVTAFVALSGLVASGFPVDLPGAGAALRTTVDLQSNVFVLGRTGDPDKIYLAGLTGSGAMRSSFPRVFGVGARTEDIPLDFVLDPAGTMYILAIQADAAPDRLYIVRQPVL